MSIEQDLEQALHNVELSSRSSSKFGAPEREDALIPGGECRHDGVSQWICARQAKPGCNAPEGAMAGRALESVARGTLMMSGESHWPLNHVRGAPLGFTRTPRKLLAESGVRRPLSPRAAKGCLSRFGRSEPREPTSARLSSEDSNDTRSCGAT